MRAKIRSHGRINQYLHEKVVEGLSNLESNFSLRTFRAKNDDSFFVDAQCWKISWWQLFRNEISLSRHSHSSTEPILIFTIDPLHTLLRISLFWRSLWFRRKVCRGKKGEAEVEYLMTMLRVWFTWFCCLEGLIRLRPFLSLWRAF